MAGDGAAWLGRGQCGMVRERAEEYHGHQFRAQSEFSQGSLLAAFLIRVGPQSRIRSHSQSLPLLRF